MEKIVGNDDGQEIISFPKLIELELFSLPRLTSLYNNNKVEFPQLKVLWIGYCEKLEVVIHCTMFHGFENIEHIKIYECHSLKTVFHHSSPAHPTLAFPALRTLSLKKLPNLESFLSYDNEFLGIDDSKSYTLFTSAVSRSFQQLLKLEVSNCNLLKEIVQDGGETHGTNNISLPELKYVMLLDLPNLQNCGIFASYIPALLVVLLDGCAISSLFTCSAFRKLRNLKSLKVTNCHMLEQILVDDMDDEIPGPSENMISLPLLKTIELTCLHGLKSFSSSSTITFSMPALKNIMVYDCLCKDKLTFLQISTPLLEDDLNDFVI